MILESHGFVMDRFLQYIKEPHAWPAIQFTRKMMHVSFTLQKKLHGQSSLPNLYQVHKAAFLLRGHQVLVHKQ